MSARRSPAHALLALTCLLALAACTSDDSQPAADAAVDAEPGSDGSTTGDAAALRAAVGTFSIELIEAVPATDELAATPAQTSIVGRVYSGAVPQSTEWQLVVQESGCRLLKPHAPFCDPSCESGETCAMDDTCVPAPRPLDVGTVVLSGLQGSAGPTELALSPLAPSNVYQPRGSSGLAYPPFDDSGEVTLMAQGGELAPFQLSAPAIEPLEVLSPDTVTIGGDEPAVLRWTPATTSGSRIEARVDISHHGGQTGELICDADDDGELELPSALIAGLIELGVAGFPDIKLARKASSEPLSGAPGLVLTSLSSITLAAEIPGFISCDPEVEDSCPDGQTCQQNHLCD